MTYGELIQYFENIGAAHRQVNTVVVADYDDVLDLQSAEIDYPALLVESPEMRYGGDDDHVVDTWSTSLVVLMKADPKRKDEVKYAKELTHRIAEQMLIKMMMTDKLLRMRLAGKRILPIDPYTSDNVHGWRIAVDYESVWSAAECYDASIWLDTVPDTIDIFTYVDSSGAELDVTVTVNSDDPAAVVTYKIDGGSEQVLNLTNNVGTITGAGDNLYVKMVSTYGDHVMVASAWIQRGKVVKGWSMPFDYDPY